MRKKFSSILALGLVAGIIGFAVYFFAFGQTFEGQVQITAGSDEPGVIGLVTFQSRFQNRRFLRHSVFLDLLPDTPTTYQGASIDAQEAVDRFSESMMEARVGYREEKAGWGYVVSLDLDPAGSSLKEMLLITSLILVFGCTGVMAVIARTE